MSVELTFAFKLCDMLHAKSDDLRQIRGQMFELNVSSRGEVETLNADPSLCATGVADGCDYVMREAVWSGRCEVSGLE